jgi:hypothetical protein
LVPQLIRLLVCLSPRDCHPRRDSRSVDGNLETVFTVRCHSSKVSTAIHQYCTCLTVKGLRILWGQEPFSQGSKAAEWRLAEWLLAEWLLAENGTVWKETVL